MKEKSKILKLAVFLGRALGYFLLFLVTFFFSWSKSCFLSFFLESHFFLGRKCVSFFFSFLNSHLSSLL